MKGELEKKGRGLSGWQTRYFEEKISLVTREKKGIHPLHAMTMVFVLAAVVYWIVIRVGKGGPADSSVSTPLQRSQQHAEEARIQFATTIAGFTPATFTQPYGSTSDMRWLLRLLLRSSSDSDPTCAIPISS